MENSAQALVSAARDLPRTYVSSGVDLRVSFQQPPHDVIVPHLCRNPQRRGAVRPRRVGLRPVFQQDFQNTKVAVLGGDEQRRGAVLSNRNYPQSFFTPLLLPQHTNDMRNVIRSIGTRRYLSITGITTKHLVI